MMNKTTLLCVTTAMLLLAGPGAKAQAITATFNNYAPSLGGNIKDYQWGGFSDATKPSGVTAGTGGKASQWSGGVTPTDSTSTIHFGGTPGFGTETTDFLASSNGGGIYTFFSSTHFSIIDTAPLADLKTLTFQVYIAEGLSGAFGGAATKLVTEPTLTLQTTSGPQTLAANFSLLSSSQSAVVNGSATNLDLLTYQWDLSGVTGTIQGYSIEWQTSFHSVTYGADVTQSDAVVANSVLAIPEPSTYAMIGSGAMGMLVLIRRRRAVRA